MRLTLGTLVSGAGGGEVGAAGLHDRLELHEFDASAIGVVEVGLPLAVPTHLRPIVFRWEAVVFVEGLNGLLHVGYAEGEMVEDSEVLGAKVFGGCGGAVAHHHVLQPVVAVGDLLGDPVDGIGFHGTVPVGTEAEKVAIKVVFVCAVVDKVADVDDARADGMRGDRDDVCEAGLKELNLVAFGVLGVEPVRAVGGGVELGCSLLVGEEVDAEGGGVGGIVGDAGHAADGVVGGEGKHLDELGGAEVVAGAGGILRVGTFRGSEEVAVEVVGGRHVLRVHTHVRDAGDGWAGLLSEGGEGREDEDCGEELRGQYFHGLGHGTYTGEDSIRTPGESWQRSLVWFCVGGEGCG
jgi:hypothetical protein